MNSTVIAITAGLAFGAAVGSIFGLVIIGAGVGIVVGTLAAGVIDSVGDENVEF